jgi:hypothetical protein
MSDFFDGFSWHSSLGIDDAVAKKKNFVASVPNTDDYRKMFIANGGSTLIHKTTKSLWKLSDDNSSIMPVFPGDILSEDDVRQAMEDV